MRAFLINGETRALSGQFKKHAAWLQEIDRLEPKTIDHRRRTRALFRDAPANFELMCFIVHTPCDVMNAAGAPCATPGRWCFLKVNIRTGFSAGDTVTMPAILRAQ